MSIFHDVPRQDRRGVGRSPVRDHASVASVHGKILDPENGCDIGDVGGGARAPGSSGSPTTED